MVLLQPVLCSAPVSLHCVGVDTSNRVHKILRVIHRSMGERRVNRNVGNLPVAGPAVGMDDGTSCNIHLDERKESGRISSIHTDEESTVLLSTVAA